MAATSGEPDVSVSEFHAIGAEVARRVDADGDRVNVRGVADAVGVSPAKTRVVFRHYAATRACCERVEEDVWRVTIDVV